MPKALLIRNVQRKVTQVCMDIRDIIRNLPLSINEALGIIRKRATRTTIVALRDASESKNPRW